MPIRLTEQQQRALDSTNSEPPQVIDPRTNEAYVLIPLTEYETVREAIEDDRRQKAIRAVAFRMPGSVPTRLLDGARRGLHRPFPGSWSPPRHRHQLPRSCSINPDSLCSNGFRGLLASLR